MQWIRFQIDVGDCEWNKVLCDGAIPFTALSECTTHGFLHSEVFIALLGNSSL